MKKELELELAKRHPILINKKTDDRNPFPMFGCECGDGWFNLLDNLMTEIDNTGHPDLVYIAQIKEKFGTLRFYVNFEKCEDTIYNKIYEIIQNYEEVSETTCEVCGKPGTLRGGGWLRTLCDDCETKKKS
jgi:hypothetical protein